MTDNQSDFDKLREKMIDFLEIEGEMPRAHAKKMTDTMFDWPEMEALRLRVIKRMEK